MKVVMKSSTESSIKNAQENLENCLKVLSVCYSEDNLLVIRL